MTAPLISSRSYLNLAKVLHNAGHFQVFVVRTVDIELRGRQYRILLDGHHNWAAARIRGVPPIWCGPSKRTIRVMRDLGPDVFARMAINHLKDADWYFVDSGEVVQELRGFEGKAA